MSRLIVRYGDFAPLAGGNGGNRRACQIVEALEDAGIMLAPLARAPKPEGLVARARWKLAGVRLGRQIGAPRGGTWRGGSIVTEAFATLSQREAGLLLWEPSARGVTVGRVARHLGWTVIALPHNLESLVPGERSPWTRRMSPDWLREELDWMRDSAAVFCISREEQWLLRVHGIDAGYVPYVPPRSQQQRLLALRSRRATVKQDCILILGTGNNPPTLHGMRAQLVALMAWPPAQRAQVVVVGYDTQRLQQEFPNSGFQLLGAVSDERLDELMARARCLFVHQVPTSGALTRITDFLLAGIPVVANVDARRNAHDAPGVAGYDHLDEALALIQSDLPEPPARLNLAAAAPLIEAITRLR